MNKHRCGGNLYPAKVKVKKKTGFYYQTFTVDGYRCDKCGDEVISRDTAFEVDKSIEQLKRLWSGWKVPGDTKETRSFEERSSGTAVNNLVCPGATNVYTP